MPENEFKADYVDNTKKTPETQDQVDKFSQTTKLLNNELSDKKDNILKVLEQGNLREVFEALLSSEDGELCVVSLLECGNTEEDIRGVILGNLPEGYTYDVSTGKIVKIYVSTTNDIYNGAVIRNQKTEQAAQKTEQAAQKTEQAAQKTEQAESLKKIAKAIEERYRLVDKYKNQNLDAKTNQNSENYQKVKQQLEQNGTLNQLRQNHDEQFINNYILVQATLLELKSNPTNYEEADISYFDKIVKNLDNACNIPDTSLSSFSSENVSQTRTELFNEDVGNESLISAKKTNMKSHDYSEVFPEMGEDDMFIKYGQFLKGNLKNYWNQYKDDYLGFMDKLYDLREQASKGKILNQEEKDFLSLPGTIKGIKEKMDNDTKNMVEELCIISQIKGMYMCMGEGENFNLNKAKEIENKNGVLTLRGHIDGVNFAIRQDTTKESPLQTYSKLGKSTDGNTFSVGGDDNFVDSNFILPTQNEIFDAIKNTVALSDTIEKFNNPADYLENLQTNIMGDMEKKYENTKYVHHYMQGQVKGEKIVDNTLGLIKEKSPSIYNNETLMKSINQKNNKDLYDFMKILKFNIDNSTESEKDNLDKCITKILEITDSYQNTNEIEPNDSFKYPDIIENYLKNSAWLNGGNESLRLGLLSELFRFYSKKSQDTRSNSEGNVGESSKMIINDLYRDLFEFSTVGKSEVCAKRKLENRELAEKKYVETNGDGMLHLNDPSIWPQA